MPKLDSSLTPPMNQLNGTLMVQGTTSDAGKSTLVCALGRIWSDLGISVVPFKPQNMALNSAVTADGGEIGRAQALQAQACRLAPHTDMNPVLLKPNSDTGAQVIIQGKAVGNLPATDYHAYKKTAMTAVLDSYKRLQQQYTSVLVEGAGSPAEINLRENDIANMGFAEAVDCPVILIADIDRGGVFAHLTGTLDCLSETEQARVIGFVINRFRGDISLLQSGLDWLEAKTGKPVLAVLPYLHGLYLDAEDAIDSRQTLNNREDNEQRLRVVMPVWPRISNHTDVDALRLHPQVELIMVGPEQTPPPADLIILPGSKNTRADLHWLQTQPGKWPDAIARHLRYGGKILGICGGMQMLGNSISDPLGIESTSGNSIGLGYLNMSTELLADKTLRQVTGELTLANQDPTPISGYEIHAGISECTEFVVIRDSEGNPGGYLNQDGNVLGTYWHGLLDTPAALSSILQWAGLGKVEVVDFNSIREQQLDRLAQATSEAFVWPKLDTALADFYQQRPWLNR